MGREMKKLDFTSICFLQTIQIQDDVVGEGDFRFREIEQISMPIISRMNKEYLKLEFLCLWSSSVGGVLFSISNIFVNEF